MVWSSKTPSIPSGQTLMGRDGGRGRGGGRYDKTTTAKGPTVRPAPEVLVRVYGRAVSHADAFRCGFNCNTIVISGGLIQSFWTGGGWGLPSTRETIMCYVFMNLGRRGVRWQTPDFASIKQHTI